MYKKAQEEQEALNSFLSTDFVIRLQAENNLFLGNVGKSDSKQVLESLQKKMPVITLSHSRMRKIAYSYDPNTEDCSSFQNVLQALNDNSDNDVMEISREQFKNEQEEKKENSPKCEANRFTPQSKENEPPVEMRFKTLKYYKNHAPRFYHNHILKQDNVFIMPTQYQYKPNLFHQSYDDDE